MKKCIFGFLGLWLSFFCIIAQATDSNTISSEPSSVPWTKTGNVYDKYKWGFLGYIGGMTNSELYHDMYFDWQGLGPGTLYVFEVDRQLSVDNWARKLFSKVVSTIELAANVTYETDPTGPLEEFNPYFIFRWREFPWNQKVLTTFAVGEGVSWASHNPEREIRTEEKADSATKFLNYLMVETTFSLPSHPEWQIMYRLHHRSGVFGLYCPGRSGSTAAGLGVRYWIE